MLHKILKSRIITTDYLQDNRCSPHCFFQEQNLEEQMCHEGILCMFQQHKQKSRCRIRLYSGNISALSLSFLLYSGTPLIGPPKGQRNLAVFTGRVKFHNLRNDIEIYHNRNS